MASDAHKLVKYQRKDYVSDKGDFSFILPKKPATLLRSVLAKDDTPLKLSFGPKTASFVFANYRMTATLVEGRFPNYNSVIPHNNNRRLIVEKKELYGSLKGSQAKHPPHNYSQTFLSLCSGQWTAAPRAVK